MDEARRPRLLVVEDNPDTQLLLQHLLRREYDAVIVPGIEQALASASERQADLLMIDINLGEQRTGVDLLAMIRENERFAQTPALALTAYALPGDAQRFLDSGFDSYLSKPFTRQSLFDAIQDALSRVENT